jgi:hypothetical protein
MVDIRIKTVCAALLLRLYACSVVGGRSITSHQGRACAHGGAVTAVVYRHGSVPG